VLAAINVGTYDFAVAALTKRAGFDPADLGEWKFAPQIAFVAIVTFLQALVNHYGIRLTARLTDFSGYWILVVATAITVCLLAVAWPIDLSRLWRFENLSGRPDGDPVWPRQDSLVVLFFLGLLLPAYTITGFDASAHAAEETVRAAERVPRGIVRSVLVSGLFGWVMLCAAVLAAPDLAAAVDEKGGSFVHVLEAALPGWLAVALELGILVAQLLCGLATVTSASRMLYAFARDGGVPFSPLFRHVHATHRTPVPAIWAVAALAVVFTVYTPAYETITAASVQMLYVSYVLPTALGLLAYGRTWTAMGPWSLGAWYRPLAVVAVAGCAGLLWVGVQEPNRKTLFILGAFIAALFAGWWCVARRAFPGPPPAAR